MDVMLCFESGMSTTPRPIRRSVTRSGQNCRSWRRRVGPRLAERGHPVEHVTLDLCLSALSNAAPCIQLTAGHGHVSEKPVSPPEAAWL